MTITFVLPRYSATPIGGYLVVYQYANELVRRGHRVQIVQAWRQEQPATPVSRVRNSYHLRRRGRQGGDGRPPWFEMADAVVMRNIPDLRESAVPDGDAIFATACTTAPAVASYSRKKGMKFYLIQHYEDWACGKEQVDATWKMPLHKVVSSRWLEEIGATFNEERRVTHIPYGVELDVFQMRKAPGKRSPIRVGMLAHELPSKGMRYGMDALNRIRGQVPELQAVLFGAVPRPESLPAWIDYVENPTRSELATLYNSFAIFMHTSVTEGWGLTAAEAMACGCALVAADSGGIRDFAKDGDTALLVPTRDSRGLSESTLELIRNHAFRERLATAGWAEMQKFTWDRAADRLDTLVRDVVQGADDP